MAFCPHCGHESSPDEHYCGQCGKSLDMNSGGVVTEPTAPQPAAGPTLGNQPPDNHLAKAIIATILCCLPAGIVAIVHASSVNGKFIAGDVAGAHETAGKADTWGNWAIGLGLAGYVIYGVIMIISVAVGS